MSTRGYQVYIIRAGRWELDGCWGSEHAVFSTEAEVREAILALAEEYSEAIWGVEAPSGARIRV